MLSDICDDKHTDKNTTHSYLELYERLLCRIKTSAKNILEIGIGDFKEKNGGSLMLWRDYFLQAKIYGIDILEKERVLDELLDDDRIILHTGTDGYNKSFVDENLKNIKFDFLIDDGPHTLKSQIKFIELYSHLITDDGILIIEDVQNISHFKLLEEAVPEFLNRYIKTYDLRQNKNRYDDLVFTIDKSI